MNSLLLLGLCAALFQEGAVAPPQAPRNSVELPPGPAARAFAGVGPTTAPTTLPGAALATLDAPEWRTPGPWTAWADAVRAEASATEPDPFRRAQLARTALAQGRFDDAWEHFAWTGAAPSVTAALLPQFLPGVTQRAEAGGIVAALPDGALLQPAIPPPSVPAADVLLGRTWIERREMRLEGLRIGAATLAMKVKLESDGIQVEFEHRAGAAAHVRVLLPELADFEVRVAYVDWMRQDEVGRVLEFDIAPGDEEHTLFGRFKPRTIGWPTNLPQGTPSALLRDGLELSFPEDAPDASLFRSAAPALESVLGLRVTTNRADTAPFPGVELDLAEPNLARRKFVGMLTLTERYVLRRIR
ncbi:MAG TPA: hypothetical protein VM509_03380 [Planctomycetota bacterium]|nr:hypothetical protein [Planctomycetota bacterium]